MGHFKADYSMLKIIAPAKINWFLRVHELRGDGYHNIDSLIQKVSLNDVLYLNPADDLKLNTDLDVPVKKNLVYRAAELIRKMTGIKKGAEIFLEKNIPVSAGLGGGSSDAASTLLGLNEIWSLALSFRELCVIAEEIGSDVPFFLHSALAYVKGRGETVMDCISSKPYNILLVKPHVPISTKWAYENLRSGREKSYMSGTDAEELTKITTNDNNIKLFIHAVGNAEMDINSSISNDLESVAIKSFPVIADIKNRLLEKGAVYTMMSGSGPTVFGVFNSASDVLSASKNFKDCWTAGVQTLTD